MILFYILISLSLIVFIVFVFFVRLCFDCWFVYFYLMKLIFYKIGNAFLVYCCQNKKYFFATWNSTVKKMLTQKSISRHAVEKMKQFSILFFLLFFIIIKKSIHDSVCEGMVHPDRKDILHESHRAPSASTDPSSGLSPFYVHYHIDGAISDEKYNALIPIL